MAEQPLRILIVQRDLTFAALLAQWFSAAGFNAVGCPTPGTNDYYCGFLQAQSDATGDRKERTPGSVECPVVEDADVLVYDPWLYVSESAPDARALIRALRRKYPHQPLILAWPDEDMPPFEPDISHEPGVHIAPRNLKRLVDYVVALCQDKTLTQETTP